MNKNENGFGIIGIVMVIVIVGLTGAVGWLVYDRQEKASDTEEVRTTAQPETDDETPDETADITDYETTAGINYVIPTGWKNVKAPYEPYENGGLYLLSPDYKEGGGGQLQITAGAFISFGALEWVGIDTSTTVAQAVDVVKNGDGGYLDSKSVKATVVGGKQVVMFDAGHTTDGVTVFHKTSSSKWLEANFSTVTGGDGDYNAQASPHYKEFQDWLVKFVEINP